MTREEALKDRFGDWYEYFKEELDKDYMIRLANTIAGLRVNKKVYPSGEDTFRAFKMTSPYETKVIIVGQDPYHDGVNATGLAFECGGVKSGRTQEVTPSWKKMLRGYDEQYPTSFATDLYEGDLTRWAKSGVLLLNSSFTVEHGAPGSHYELWKPFTRFVIDLIARSQKPKVFMFFGRKAQFFQNLVRVPHHGIYREHPAAALYNKPGDPAEGRLWEHGNCFMVANDFLKQNGIEPIDW